MTRRSRRLVGTAIGAVATALLVLLFAAPRLSAPWLAAATGFAPQDWVSPSGHAKVEGELLRVQAGNPPGTALITHEPLQLQAAQFRYLHYRASEIADDARMLLLWRGEGDLQRQVLPRVLRGGTLDLAQLPGWNGEIRMLGVAVVPIDYLAADAVTQQEFVLARLELRPDNWASAVSALLTDWLAPRPWTGASINTGGNEFGLESSSLTGFVACWIGLMLVGVRVLAGRVALQRAAPLLVLAGACLLALDLGRDVLGRTVAVTHAAARVADVPQRPLAADPGLAADATQLRAALAQEAAARTRMLVHAGHPFRRDYAVYLLRDFDVAALLDLRRFATRATLDGAVLVLADRDGWAFDAQTSQITLGGQSRLAIPLWQGDHLVAFRLPAAGATP